MRLIRKSSDGRYVLENFSGDDIPEYAVLSHTWRAREEEVSFEDVITNKDRYSQAWDKIEFCSRQAEIDGLQYCWVVTCCINKNSSVELSEAINSMFGWYKKARKCYVYLSDVSLPANSYTINDWKDKDPVAADFAASRWFTRGWTLQELIVPTSVDFYDREGRKLGDKQSLAALISQITAIPEALLRGEALSNFSIAERLSWMDRRSTTRAEDLAYSVMGLFDVFMPIIYGEGVEMAQSRLEVGIRKSLKGPSFDQFAVTINLASLPERTRFVGREAELKDMHRFLYGHETRSVTVLCGAAGTGKTQLAHEYAMRNVRNYSAIFWLNATDGDSLSLCSQGIANQILINHPSTPGLAGIDVPGNLRQTIDAVRVWLDLPGNTEWLLVYDNLDDTESLALDDGIGLNMNDFLPNSKHGSIIVTTRSMDMDLGNLIPVSDLSVQDSIEVLHQTSRRWYGQTTDSTDEDARALVEEIGGSPLVLTSAGAYLHKTSMTYAEYRQSLTNLSSPQRNRRIGSPHPRTDSSLHKILQLSFDKVQQQNPLSAKVLKLWAYFDRQDVWFDLLRPGTSTDNPWPGELVKDEVEFYAAMHLLYDFGLVGAVSANEQFGFRGFSMHEAVHSWVVSALNKQWDDNLAQFALNCVAAAAPPPDAKERSILQRRLLQHISRLMQFMVDGNMKMKQTGRPLYIFGSLLLDQGKLIEAERMLRKALLALPSSEEADEHTLTLDVLAGLARLYANQGDLDRAGSMFLQALQGKEKAFGAMHISTLDAVNDFAANFVDQGRLSDAELLYIRALKGKEETLGTTHPSTLTTMHNIGLLYMNQGRLIEAETILVRVLASKRATLGTEHPSTLNTMQSMANLYADQGKLGEAERIFELVFLHFGRLLGFNHPTTLDVLSDLGTVYADQGQLTKAESCFQRTLEYRERALGRNHPLTLEAYTNLGTLYTDQIGFNEAEKYLELALQGLEKVYGPDHPTTLDTVGHLGILYANQGMFDKAEMMYLRALVGIEKVLGVEHTSTLSLFNNTGNLYANQGMFDKAEAMYLRALVGLEKALGPQHASTLDTVNNLGILYADQGMLEKAEVMYSRALVGMKEVLGAEHTSTLRTANNLRKLHAIQGKVDKAEGVYEKALDRRKTERKPEHALKFDTRKDRGKRYYPDRGKSSAIQGLYQRAVGRLEDLRNPK